MKVKIKLFIQMLAVTFIISCQSRNEISSHDNGGSKTGKQLKTEVKRVTPNMPSDSIYRVPDVLATYQGGDFERVKFFEENLKIPEKMENKDKNKVVFLTFVVEPDSTVKIVKIAKGIDSAFDQEAIRVVKLAKWNPGKVHGNSVRSELTFPVIFKINN